MPTPLLMITDHPTLRNHFDELKTVAKNADEAKAFLQKQADNMAKRLSEQKDEVWKNVHDYLLSRNLLPSDYSKDKSYLSLRDGVLFKIDYEEEDADNESGIPPEILAIIKKLRT